MGVTEAKTLEELVDTKEYKDSRYELVEIESGYCLKIKGSGVYLSMSGNLEWSEPEHIRRFCIGTQRKVLEVFYDELKEKKEIDDLNAPIIEKRFKGQEDKSIESTQDYKNKLMEGL